MAADANEKRKPGRPKETAAAEKIGPEFVTETPKDMQQAEAAWHGEQIEHDRNLVVIDKQYGDSLPYDITRLENETRFYLGQSAESMVQAGKRLVVIKEHEGHGQFLSSLQRIGLEPRTAQLMMKASIKFGTANAKSITHLGSTKLFALLTQDDEDLEALSDGGTVAGLKLDDIEKMSVRELKAALRAERELRAEDADVKERLLASKEQKVNLLERELDERKLRVKKWDGVVSEITSNVTIMAGGAIQQINHLRTQIEQIQEESKKFDLSKQEMEAIVKPFADHISTLGEYFRELEAEFGLNLSVYMPAHGGNFIEHSED
ncbi:DUF3102 domain-containing protein [Pseudohongiella sp.]|uniref:DUF3102 domain-containing protein n=1 Tax=marine sediment metagenome TaxID=412755 RepID=A0A0F9VS14_9ZZZZ|nr:DUF3102 domain-containing protein [Pseudohongiella sp.]HDZ10050.1 DUF3102 domain-containing protein [Pseudohongiella sp.]HEA63399.1 DUF3102 domain-containing protein [Pseudohongiella sp.]